jgi:hypothetical protein
MVRADVSWYARRLAIDLGASATDDPIDFILGHVDRQIRRAAKKQNAKSLPELLAAAAQETSTRFEVVDSDSQLNQLITTFIERGEIGFAQLSKDFEDSFGVTLRLLKRRSWEPAHVSVIDCRGSKAYKSYYTKWHELAHLLTLTRQGQLKFRRTHTSRQPADEALMEMLAGHFGYWSDMLRPHLHGELTFATLKRIKGAHCVEGSWQSFVHAAVERWPGPSVYLRAELKLKRQEERQQTQTVLWVQPPGSKLRISDLAVNAAARSAGAELFLNMRVPEQSILYRIFTAQEDAGTALECLSMWESSDRGALRAHDIIVTGQPAYNGVEGLIAFN